MDLVEADHPEFAPESSIISSEAATFFKTWPVEKSPEKALGYLGETINFCGDLERTTNVAALSARNRQLLIETMRAANKEVKKANTLNDAIHAVAPVDPYIKAVDHENKEAFTLAVFTDGDARQLVCSSKASELTAPTGERRARTYGENYVTKFRFALDNGKGGILRLMWKRDGNAWRIAHLTRSSHESDDSMTAEPKSSNPNPFWLFPENSRANASTPLGRLPSGS